MLKQVFLGKAKRDVLLLQASRYIVPYSTSFYRYKPYRKKLLKKIKKKIIEELNTRNIGDLEVLMSNKVLEKMELMMQKVVDTLDKIDQMEKQYIPQYHE